MISFDVRDQLAKVNVPTLLITPADDRLVGEKAARELTEGMPAAREVVLPGTGHMFRFTHPGLYGRTIIEFLAELDDWKRSAPRSARSSGQQRPVPF